MLEPSLYRQRHTVLDVVCRVKTFCCRFKQDVEIVDIDVSSFCRHFVLVTLSGTVSVRWQLHCVRQACRLMLLVWIIPQECCGIRPMEFPTVNTGQMLCDRPYKCFCRLLLFLMKTFAECCFDNFLPTLYRKFLLRVLLCLWLEIMKDKWPVKKVLQMFPLWDYSLIWLFIWWCGKITGLTGESRQCGCGCNTCVHIFIWWLEVLNYVKVDIDCHLWSIDSV